MPTIITHAFVGLVSARLYALREYAKRFWFFSIFLPIVPDFDVIGFYFNVAYSDFLGHRGFFHSIFFAFVLSFFVVLIFFRKIKFLSQSWILLYLYFSALTSTHALFDAMTNGGLGVALLAPFDNSRIFLPFRPIEVSPLGIQAFFSQRGLEVIISEFYYIWIPFILLFAILLFIKNRSKNSQKQYFSRRNY